MVRKSTVAWAIVAVAALGLLYVPVLVRLARDWLTDDNYSHGVLILPLAVYFVWERRARLMAATARPTGAGLAVIVGGLGLLMAGTLGAELFLTRVSLIAVLAGATLFLKGGDALRVLSFPLAFLGLMIPIPAILFNQIAFPLQLIASQVGQAGLQLLGIPVLREGNVIVLAHATLEVAEACSGIRSLVSLLTLGVIYGYFTDPRGPVRTAIALSAVPIAVITNGTRVAGTGVAAHYYGAEAAQGFFHTFSGWLVFAAGFVLLLGLGRLVLRLFPGHALNRGAEPATA